MIIRAKPLRLLHNEERDGCYSQPERVEVRGAAELRGGRRPGAARSCLSLSLSPARLGAAAAGAQGHSFSTSIRFREMDEDLGKHGRQSSLLAEVDVPSRAATLSPRGQRGEAGASAQQSPPALDGGAEKDEEDEDDEDPGYTVEHLSAVVRPVALTMILARCAARMIVLGERWASISRHPRCTLAISVEAPHGDFTHETGVRLRR